VYSTRNVPDDKPDHFGVSRISKSCENNHSIPDLPKGFTMAESAYVAGNLYICGGWNPERTKTASACYALDITHIDSDWREVARMSPQYGKEVFSMVAYGNKLYAVGGTQNGHRVGYRAIKNCEEYDPAANKWSKRSNFYGDWKISSGCIAADTETGRVYSLGGYSLDDRHSNNNYHKWRYEVFVYDYNANTWNHWTNMPVAREKHTCGIIKRISDEHKILFFTGGWFVYQNSDGPLPYNDYDFYHAMQYDLTNYPDTSYNYTMVGTIKEIQLEYAIVSPYEGFIFKWAGGTTSWWIWDERREDFLRPADEFPRDSNRDQISVAAIPKTSPMVQNCL